MPASPAAAIVTAGLSKSYGAARALDALDLRVEIGEVFGFLGPNGAGKTTTIRLLLGLLHPSRGGADVLGLDPWRDSVALHRRLAFVPGEVQVWPQLTGGEMIDLLGRVHGSWDDEYRAELIERFAFDPTKRCRSYSRGNRQKIALIAAFMMRPDLLVLDEPSSGLDPLMEIEFRNCVNEARRRGQTTFLSSHILSEVELLCDRVGILRGGKLIDVATLDGLRELAALEMEVEYRGAAPTLVDLDGARDVTDDCAGRLRFAWRGEPGPLLARLAAADVVSFTSREPDLEQLVLRFYDGDNA